jgi:hypothetical protein
MQSNLDGGRYRKRCIDCGPVPAMPLSRRAPTAGLTPRRFDHPIHQLRLLEDLVQHWTAETEVAHGESSCLLAIVGRRPRTA